MDTQKTSSISDSLPKDSATFAGSTVSESKEKVAETTFKSTSNSDASFEDVCSFPQEGALVGPTLSDHGWICMWRTSATGLATIHYTDGWKTSLPVHYDNKTKLP